MDTLEKRLCSIREAYACGRLKPIIELSDKDFYSPTKDIWETALSTTEQEIYTQITQYREAGLQAARQKKYAIADILFVAAEKAIQSNTLPAVGSLVAQSTYEAAVAYLDYRREQFERGTERIYRALELDETLEENYGYPQIQLHRLRLLLNLVRLKRRQGHTEEALQMSSALLDYLEHYSSSLPFPTYWNARNLEHVPFANKNFQFEQATAEIMFLVAGQEAAPEGFLHVLETHTQPVLSPLCEFSPRSHAWFQARRALQMSDVDGFLYRTHPLIAAGAGDMPCLWYAILIDLVVLCSKFHLKESSLLLEDITADTASWPWAHLPPAWKLILQKAASYVHS